MKVEPELILAGILLLCIVTIWVVALVAAPVFTLSLSLVCALVLVVAMIL